MYIGLTGTDKLFYSDRLSDARNRKNKRLRLMMLMLVMAVGMGMGSIFMVLVRKSMEISKDTAYGAGQYYSAVMEEKETAKQE